MKACYDKLLKILIDRKMTKTDLRKQAKISSSTLAKIGKQEIVSSDVLIKICDTLQCDIGDIVELRFGGGVLKFKVLVLKETVKKEEAPTLYEIIND